MDFFLKNKRQDEGDASPKQTKFDVWLQCFAFFFIMMANYSWQVVRDSQVVIVGKENSGMLLFGTTLVSFLFAPLAKMIVHRTVLDTARSLIMFFRAYGLLLFLGSFIQLYCERVLSEDDGGKHGFAVALVFLLHMVTQSVNNLAVSALWSFSLSLLDGENEQKHLSLFGASSTLGQAAGSLFSTAALSYGASIPHIFFIVVISVEATSQSIWKLIHRCDNASQNHGEIIRTKNRNTRGWLSELKELLIAKYSSFLEGYLLIAKGMMSRYVVLVSIYTLCCMMSMTIFYLERSGEVTGMKLSLEESGELTANVNIIVAMVIFCLQLIFAVCSVSNFLASSSYPVYVLPFVASLGCIALFLKHDFSYGSPLMITFGLDAGYRIVAFAVTKQVRESFYRNMAIEERFLIKGFVDTFISRAGSTIAAFLFHYVHMHNLLRSLTYAGICISWWIASAALVSIRLSSCKKKD